MSKKSPCRCSVAMRQRYLARLSSPLLDRIDIRLRIPEVNSAQVELDRQNPNRQSSGQLRETIAAARAKVVTRNRQFGFELNSQATTSALRAIYSKDPSVTEQLDRALKAGLVNLRGYDRCLRIALTVADFAGHEVSANDIAKAVVLRGEELAVAA